VDVEIWKDESTGQFIRIKRITYIHVNKKVMRMRSDYYLEDGAEQFSKVLAEEVRYLTENERY